jgi:hypothetical protein
MQTTPCVSMAKKKEKQKELLGLCKHKVVIIREGKKNCHLEHARKYQRQNDLETQSARNSSNANNLKNQ